MAIQPLDAIALHDLNARFPFFSALSFVGMDQPAHPAHGISRQVSESAAINPTNLKFGDIAPADQSRRSGPAPSARVAEIRPRSISFPLMSQNVPSTGSITLIAGLAERHIATPRSIALYERTAQPAHTPRTVAIG